MRTSNGLKRRLRSLSRVRQSRCLSVCVSVCLSVVMCEVYCLRNMTDMLLYGAVCVRAWFCRAKKKTTRRGMPVAR